MIVCIHGLFTSPAFWEPVADRLSATHRVLRFSLPGFGDSEKPAQGTFQYRTADFVRILADIVSSTEERNVTLLSHAHGASLALAFAQEFPVFLKSAVLVSPSVFAPPGGLSRFSRPPFGSFVLKQFVGERLFVMLQSKGFQSSFQGATAHCRDWFASFAAPNTREATVATLLHASDLSVTSARIPSIRTPCLVLGGIDDPWVTPTLARRLSYELPNATLDLLNCGHFAPVEAPDEVVAQIERFQASLAGRVSEGRRA